MSRLARAAVPTEHQEQTKLFQWCELAKAKYPALSLLFAIPNAGGYKGGYGSNVRLVMRAKREGVRKGVPDLMLPVALGGYHGLFVELKRVEGGAISSEQTAWHVELREQGYRVEVCKGWDSARDVLVQYLTPAPALARPRANGEQR